MQKLLTVALVSEVMDTGLAQLIEMLARGLDSRGHEVHLLHSLRRCDPNVLARLRASSRVRLAAIDMRRELGVSDVFAAHAIRRYLAKHGPFDVVHGHSSKGGALARLAAVGLGGVRVYTPHAFYTLSSALRPGTRRVYGVAERALAGLSDAIVCSSAVEREHALSLGLPASRLKIVENAIEPMTLAPPARHRFGFADDAVIVGFIGRLVHQKGADILVEAAARARAAFPSLAFVMVGDGAWQERLHARARTLGLDGHMRWLGRQPAEAWLASFDILAMPSRYEGFSLIPLLAMESGLPIACARVGGVAETVDDETGLVVPVEDPDALAAALVRLARDPGRRVAMGAAARARRPLFTPERMVTATERIYLDLVAARAPSPEPRALAASARKAAP